MLLCSVGSYLSGNLAIVMVASTRRKGTKKERELYYKRGWANRRCSLICQATTLSQWWSKIWLWSFEIHLRRFQGLESIPTHIVLHHTFSKATIGPHQVIGAFINALLPPQLRKVCSEHHFDLASGVSKCHKLRSVLLRSLGGPRIYDVAHDNLQVWNFKAIVSM